jgi:hypothetical protein
MLRGLAIVANDIITSLHVHQCSAGWSLLFFLKKILDVLPAAIFTSLHVPQCSAGWSSLLMLVVLLRDRGLGMRPVSMSLTLFRPGDLSVVLFCRALLRMYAGSSDSRCSSAPTALTRSFRSRSYHLFSSACACQ